MEIVTLRVRRIGRSQQMALPELDETAGSDEESIELMSGDGTTVPAIALQRGALELAKPRSGPLLIVDDDATTYVPTNWRITRTARALLVLERLS